MNTEIKFKAKSKETEEHDIVYGYYGIKGQDTELEKHFIMQPTFSTNTSGYPFYFTDIEVHADTVSEFTGFQDINGKDLYGGDQVKEWLEDTVEPEGGFWHHSRIEKVNGCWVVLSLSYDYSKADFPNDYTFLYEDAKYILIED